MIAKGIVVLFMLIILFSLGGALIYLVKDGGRGERTLKALKWRIGLSLFLFLLLLLGFSLGLITPHGLSM